MMIGRAQTEDALYRSFQTPEQDMRPAPLWFWNRQVEDMTTEQVRELVRESYRQSGYKGFGILPEWQTAYMSEEYFRLYEAALDEGSKYGMQFSLYDENGFPSYNAGGLLEEKYPELTTKRLDMLEKDGKQGDVLRLEWSEGKLMGAVAMNTDTYERVDITDKAVVKDPPPFDPDAVPVGVSASTTYTVSPGYEADKAVDGDPSTRWNSESMSGGKQYLMMKYNAPQTFDQVKVYEDKDKNLHRTQSYAVQYYDRTAGEWVELASGKTITDKGVSHTFQPVTADLVRLYIGRVSGDSATISEFQVLSGGQALPVPAEEGTAAPGVSCSSRYNESYDASAAFDGSFATRWNAKDATNPPHWLEMSFGSPRTVDSAKIYQSMDRISGFQIQYWSEGEWKTCHTGTSIGLDREGSHISFAPVTTSRMRLYITETKDYNPSIWELEFYNGDQKLIPDQGGAEETYDGSYLEYTLPAGNWKVMVFLCVADSRDGMDYLSRESVAAFIEVTYEEYYKRFKKYFDNGTITTAFFDEPSFWPAGGRTPYGAEGGRFWTPGFNEDYAGFFTENPVLDYPAMFMDVGGDTAAARDRLMYVRSEEFAHNYIGQVNEWCENHGIQLTGHMLFEEWTNPVGSDGDLMKCFREQAIPGVDVIGSYGYSQEAYKVISSSAYNWDKGKVMSESFGVFGGDSLDPFYKSAMDQFAKGVNLIIPHALWYDDDPQYVTYVPELSYRSETFGPRLRELGDYLARAHTLLQDGRHVADVAMLYPIDDLEAAFYFNDDTNNPPHSDYMQISELLSLNARRDFTYLHPDVMAERCRVDGDTLRLDNDVNFEAYKVFVLPGCKVIDLETLETIKAFYDAGGKVIATTQLPYIGTRAEDNQKVKAIIQEMFGVDPENMPAPKGPVYRSSSDHSSNYGAAQAFDGVLGETSRWNAGKDGGDQWLEVEFPKAVTVDRTLVTERFDRVTGYRIEYFDEAAGQWKACCTGGRLGADKEDRFAAVETKRLRLYITGVNMNSVSIEEFEVYGGDSENLALDASEMQPAAENEAGGKAYFISGNASRNLQAALDDALPVYDVEVDAATDLTGGFLSYIHKVKEGRNLYLLANSSDNQVDGVLQLRGEMRELMWWDPVTGRREPVKAAAKQVDGRTVTEVELSLTAIQSLFLVEGPSDGSDATTLQAAVDKAETAKGKTELYGEAAPAVRTAFDAALAAANRLLTDPSAEQALLDQACRTLLEAVDQLSIKGGDMDGSGGVTIQDVMEACKVLARQSAGKPPTEDEMIRGNLDGDKVFSISDVMEICKILARKA
ncbi:MAG: hypothetical protein HFE86_01055 [Clostridiales bacterium]|nr:hypothetical protein [Clostridiales bacterium]